MKTIKYISFIILTAFAAAACSDDNNGKNDGKDETEVNLKIVFDQPEEFYLGQSKEIAYTLPEDQPTSITAVEVPEGWTVDISADARTIAIHCGHSAVNGTAQVVLSDDNDNNSKTPLTLSNNGENFYVLEPVVYKGLPIRNISPGGQWVAGFFSTDGFIHKVGTGTFQSFSTPVYGVSDDGTPKFEPNEGSDVYVGRRDIKINMPDGGFNTFHIPIVVLDGVTHDLPQPSTDYAGRGTDKLYCGHIASFISEDRKIIVGYMLDLLSARLAVMWKLNEDTDEYEYHFIRQDMFKAVNSMADEYVEQTGSMSYNGRYVACSYIKDGVSLAAIYDTETDELVIMNEQPDALGLIVSDNGKLFFGSPRESRQRESFVYENGSVVTFRHWIEKTYNILMPTISGSMIAHTKDWNSIVWFEYSAEFGGFGSYVITNRDVLAANEAL